jgi:hypothetical protein
MAPTGQNFCGSKLRKESDEEISTSMLNRYEGIYLHGVQAVLNVNKASADSVYKEFSRSYGYEQVVSAATQAGAEQSGK